MTALVIQVLRKLMFNVHLSTLYLSPSTSLIIFYRYLFDHERRAVFQSNEWEKEND